MKSFYFLVLLSIFCLFFLLTESTPTYLKSFTEQDEPEEDYDQEEEPEKKRELGKNLKRNQVDEEFFLSPRFSEETILATKTPPRPVVVHQVSNEENMENDENVEVLKNIKELSNELNLEKDLGSAKNLEILGKVRKLANEILSEDEETQVEENTEELSQTKENHSDVKKVTSPMVVEQLGVIESNLSKKKKRGKSIIRRQNTQTHNEKEMKVDEQRTFLTSKPPYPVEIKEETEEENLDSESSQRESIWVPLAQELEEISKLMMEVNPF